jgi:hypothetical protein
MKLISEFTENDLEFITEQDKKTGSKNYKIRGIFAQAEKKESKRSNISNAYHGESSIQV